jgi:hypothetical protein
LTSYQIEGEDGEGVVVAGHHLLFIFMPFRGSDNTKF